MATFSRFFIRLAFPPAGTVPRYGLARNYYVKPKDKSRGSFQAWITLAGITLGIGGLSLYLLGRPEDTIVGLEAEPDKYGNEAVLKAYLFRARDKVVSFKRNYTEPSNEKLLPELLPPPYQRRYTLLIELKDILVHSEYDRLMGWKHQKRPGLDMLLNKLFDYYEIVIFTSENAISTHPLIEKMDPNQFIIYRLYRDSTKYIDGHHVKDLTNLNRSLNRVIILDTDPYSVKFQPENSIILKKWTGDIYDTTLVDLTSFLLTIAVSDTDDVRHVLDYYKSHGDDNILETFKDKQAILREAEEKRQAVSKSSMKKELGSINVFSLSNLNQQYNATPLDMPMETPPPTPTTPPSSEGEKSWSVVDWIGSWIGIK